MRQHWKNSPLALTPIERITDLPQPEATTAGNRHERLSQERETQLRGLNTPEVVELLTEMDWLRRSRHFHMNGKIALAFKLAALQTQMSTDTREAIPM